MRSFSIKIFWILTFNLIAGPAWAPPFFRPPPHVYKPAYEIHRPPHEPYGYKPTEPPSPPSPPHESYEPPHGTDIEAILKPTTRDKDEIPPELKEASSLLTSNEEFELPYFLRANRKMVGWLVDESKYTQAFVLSSLMRSHQPQVFGARVVYTEISYAEYKSVLAQYKSSRITSVSQPTPPTKVNDKLDDKVELPRHQPEIHSISPSAKPINKTEGTKKHQTSANSSYELSIALGEDVPLNKFVINTPRFEFFGLEKKIRQRRFLENAAIPPETDAALFLSPDLPFPTHELLPKMISARTFDHSGRFIDKHWGNLNHLKSWRPVPENTTFFNLLPENSVVLKQMKLRGSSSRWSKARAKYENFATTNNLQKPTTISAKALLDELTNGTTDTIVVSAHGDRNSIFFPDGSRLTIDDILSLPPLERQNPPVVILVSCNTGRASSAGINTIAQALLYRGRATAVIAPTTKIPATVASLSFLQSLFSRADIPAYQSLRDISGPWQLYVNNENFFLDPRPKTNDVLG